MSTKKKAEAAKSEASPRKSVAEVAATVKPTKENDEGLTELELRQVTGGSSAAEIARPAKRPLYS